MLEALLQRIDDAYAEPAHDYRGRAIGREHVRKYLLGSYHRTLETARLLQSAPPGRMLDIGIGYGFYDMLLKQSGADVVGLELPENIPVYCRLLEAEGIPVFAGRLGALPADLQEASFDTVVLAEVFEHLRIAPMRALREILWLLRPGGRMLLTTPNIARWQNIGRLARGRNILERLPEDDEGLEHITDSIQHIREYTLDELVDLVGRAGFRVTLAKHSLSKDLPSPSSSVLGRGSRQLANLALHLVPPAWRGLLVVVAEKPSTDGAPRSAR